MPALRVNDSGLLDNVEIVDENNGRVLGRGQFMVDMDPRRPGDVMSPRFQVTRVYNQSAGTAALATDQLGDPVVVRGED